MHTAAIPDQSPAGRVSTLELFFDLVFVFAITQVTDLILHGHDAAGIAKAFLVLTLTWWIYGGYAWLTNTVGTTQPLNRVLLLAAMAGFLVMALAVPQALGSDGLAFGLAYLFVNVIHTTLYTRAADASSARAIWRVAPFNIASALIIIVAGLVAADWKVLLWATAVAVLAIVPFVARVGDFALQPAHLVERFGLVLIIALGESIISIGVGAAGEPVTLPLVTAATLALALSAALWWSYFAHDERLAEHAVRSATGPERARMALYGFGYAQLIMIGGIVVSAAGVKLVLSHLHEETPLSTSALLAAGIAMYLLGDLFLRRMIGVPSSAVRAATAALCVLTIAIGVSLGGTVQVATLVLLFVAMLSVEHVIQRHGAPNEQSAIRQA